MNRHTRRCSVADMPGMSNGDSLQEMTHWPIPVIDDSLTKRILHTKDDDKKHIPGFPMGKERGRFIRVLLAAVLPIIVLTALCSVMFYARYTEYSETVYTRRIVQFCVELADVMHSLQKERDLSALYVSTLGQDKKPYLVEQYQETDHTIQSLTRWGFQSNTNAISAKNSWLTSKELFLNHLNRHRYTLDAALPTVFEEINFYSQLIAVIMDWFFNTMKSIGAGTIWKLMVALQETMVSKEMFGMERAYGTVYFLNGGFDLREQYLLFLKAHDIGNATLTSAMAYSDIVQTVYIETVDGYQSFVDNIQDLRRTILIDPWGKGIIRSFDRAEGWFDNMTKYVDALLVVQRNLTVKIRDDLLLEEDQTQFICLVMGAVLAIAEILCIALLLEVLCGLRKLRVFSRKLKNRGDLLKSTEDCSAKIQNCMVPSLLAEKLLKSNSSLAKSYDCVSILRSEIVDFNSITLVTSPEQMVEIVDILYRYLHECVSRYNVTNLEAMAGSFMVVAGCSTPSDNQHSSAIASMALDLKRFIRRNRELHAGPDPLRIRIGCHSGPVVSAVVAAKTRHFMLFGDTVDLTEKLQKTSKDGMIQMSPAMNDLLAKNAGFVTKPRFNFQRTLGMQSYWLLRDAHDSDHSSSRLAFETDTSSGHQEECGLEEKCVGRGVTE